MEGRPGTQDTVPLGGGLGERPTCDAGASIGGGCPVTTGRPESGPLGIGLVRDKGVW